MTCNRALIRYRENRFDQCRQLIQNIVVHAVVGMPWAFGRVYIEARPLAKIVAFIVGNLIAPGAGIRCHDGHAQFCSRAMGAAFLHEVFVCAVRPKASKDRHFLSIGNLRWQTAKRMAQPRLSDGWLYCLCQPPKLLLLLRFSGSLTTVVRPASGRPPQHPCRNGQRCECFAFVHNSPC